MHWLAKSTMMDLNYHIVGKSNEFPNTLVCPQVYSCFCYSFFCDILPCTQSYKYCLFPIAKLNKFNIPLDLLLWSVFLFHNRGSSIRLHDLYNPVLRLYIMSLCALYFGVHYTTPCTTLRCTKRTCDHYLKFDRSSSGSLTKERRVFRCKNNNFSAELNFWNISGTTPVGNFS